MKITIVDEERTLVIEQEIADYDDAKHVVTTILAWSTFAPSQIDDMFQNWGMEVEEMDEA